MPFENPSPSHRTPDWTSVDLRVVLGSHSVPGRLHRALERAIARAAARGRSADLVDLGTLGVGFADGREPIDLGEDTAAVVAAISASKALIAASPVYRGSMTGSLKNLFDLIPVPALRGKVVGIVAMGATDHHYLGAERHIRDVLAFFGAFAMPVAVYLTAADFENGAPKASAETALDELFSATAEAATALAGNRATREPAPLAARMIRRRTVDEGDAKP